MDRRDFIKALSISMAGCAAGCGSQISGQPGYKFSYNQTNYLRPPGALSEEKFLESCMNCTICAESCPIGAIQLFTSDLGNRIVPHTPYIIAAETACDLCLKCTTVCPAGTLMPVEKPEDVNMGLAILEENLCFPFINQGGCGACYTICPVNAIKLDMQRYPKVIDDKCVGCGLCEEICLQKVKAIRIVQNKTVTQQTGG